MKRYDVNCPNCGYMNRDLYLEDSKGWMECEECGGVFRVKRKKQEFACAHLSVIPGGLLRSPAPDARIGA